MSNEFDLRERKKGNTTQCKENNPSSTHLFSYDSDHMIKMQKH